MKFDSLPDASSSRGTRQVLDLKELSKAFDAAKSHASADDEPISIAGVLASLPLERERSAARLVEHLQTAQSTDPAARALIQEHGDVILNALLRDDPVDPSAFAVGCRLVGDRLTRWTLGNQGWIARRAAQQETLLMSLLVALPKECWFACLKGEAWRSVLRQDSLGVLVHVYENLGHRDVRGLNRDADKQFFEFSLRHPALLRQLKAECPRCFELES